jgi:uncharacterized small protein (DUF1192 family)
MASLRMFRSKSSEPKHSRAMPKDWSTKDVVKFLEQQGLNAYAAAAKKSKLKGVNLLNAATTPFFQAPRVDTEATDSAAPATPGSGAPYGRNGNDGAGGVPPLRASASSPNFNTLVRSKSFIFAPCGPRRNSGGPAGVNAESEALKKLCDQLGILSVVDKRRLWLALLMLQRQQDEQQSQCNGNGSVAGATKVGAPLRLLEIGMPYGATPFAASDRCVPLRREAAAAAATVTTRPRASSSAAPPPLLVNDAIVPPPAPAEQLPACDDLELSEETGGRKRSSSFSSVPLDTNSDDFFSVPAAPVAAPPPQLSDALPPSPGSPAMRRFTTLRRKSSKEMGVAVELVTSLALASPTRKHRSSIGPVATIRKWITPSPNITVSPPESPSSSTTSPEGTKIAIAATNPNQLAASTKSVRTAPPSPFSTAKKFKGNPTLAYPDRHGVVVVKCCLQLSALTLVDSRSMAIVPTKDASSDSDSEESSSSSEDLPSEIDERRRKKHTEENAFYDDISLLRLDAKELHYADLTAEINRLHGQLLMAIFMQQGAKGVVRVSYKDAEGDTVGVQSDDSLRYAYEDWKKTARRRPKKHCFMRLLVEVESTSPICNK